MTGLPRPDLNWPHACVFQPIARLSAESYKERKANNGQTLTRLGKWWGRKPLVLVRAAILGMLMPASADARRDREVFLQLLTMDDDGAWLRCNPGVWSAGRFQRCHRDLLAARVQAGELKLLLGTDAASEGLNLQRLGTLINIDLPWNPTRLEQRKGRIQRIGQPRSDIWIANLRYRGSVEDRVHQVLADRLEAIHQLFGQVPDTLEDVWVKIALEGEQEARQLIDRTTATRNPFDAKYSRVVDADWETGALVLEPQAVKEQLSRAW